MDALNNEPNLEAENEFMKMKLMLERGATFSETGNMDLPAEVENEFLRNILEFEKQFDACKMIRVFDKIKRPVHFKPVKDIPCEEIGKAWEELSDHLERYGVCLNVCSPNITVRELYRFTIEELFEQEIEDMNVPGMTQVFIYDEFHPDPVYENTRDAVDHCMKLILEKKPLEWLYAFNKEGLKLNEHYPLAIEEFKTRINRFKEAYDELEMKEINVLECVVKEKQSWVNGNYKVTAVSGKETQELSGTWKVIFELDAKFGGWNIKEIQIDGIRF